MTGPRTEPGRRQPSPSELLGPADVVEHITTHSDLGWEHLPNRVPQPWGLTFDDGDRRLAAATNAAGQAEDVDPWLVTDDVDFVENLKAEDIQMQVSVWPVSTGVTCSSRFTPVGPSPMWSWRRYSSRKNAILIRNPTCSRANERARWTP